MEDENSKDVITWIKEKVYELAEDEELPCYENEEEIDW